MLFTPKTQFKINQYKEQVQDGLIKNFDLIRTVVLVFCLLDNLESPVTQKKFSQFLLKNSGRYGLTFTEHIEGKFAFVKRSETMKSPVGTLSNGTVLRQQDEGTKSRQVPIWQKSNLTLEEAAAYSGIGINKLRSMTDSDECKFVLWNGTKRLIKRRKLDEYLDKAFSI